MTARRLAVPVEDRPMNNLLRRLNEGDYALIAEHLEYENATPSDLLYSPGENVQIVYFPCGPALVSFLIHNEDGRDVETILVGREGAVGDGVVAVDLAAALHRADGNPAPQVADDETSIPQLFI